MYRPIWSLPMNIWMIQRRTRWSEAQSCGQMRLKSSSLAKNWTRRVWRRNLWPRAGRYISVDTHAHLVSKAGSLISGKFPLPAFKWSRISLTSYAISLSLSQMNRLRLWTRYCLACQWTTALCIKCRSIWKTEHIPTVKHGGGNIMLWGVFLLRRQEHCTASKGRWTGLCTLRTRALRHSGWKRGKVTNYIYSRYCNWVAFLCTCTFLSNFLNL